MSARSQTSWWDRIDRTARGVETSLIVVILGGLIVLGAAQIVLRNFFSIGFSWSDGLVRLAVLWLGMLGALAASRDGRHITLSVATRWLPPRAQILAGACADWFGAVVSAVLAWYAWLFVNDSREFGATLLNNLPAWWFQSIMPVAFALMAWRFFAQGIRRLRGGGPVASGPL